ncbi:MAG: hypothetical protein GQ527_07015, partial [Bacteroidales bacterium]|nr:hypothetical protein [Bacteroidales bacterium]
MIRLKYNFHILLIIILLGSSCNNRFQVNLSDIDKTKISIGRYEQDLFSQELSEERIDTLQKDYPLFLGDTPLDSISMQRLKSYVTDPFLMKVYEEIENVFPNVSEQEENLSTAFRFIKYYDPKFEYPIVYTYLSGTQDEPYYQDQIVMISLDRFLGQGNELYHMIGISKYKQNAMQKSYFTREVLKAIAYHYIPPVS